MSTLVPQETLDTLKCSLCKKYLTVPPILTISKDSLRHKCGRCQDIQTELEVRNVIFESLAALSTYPCTFPPCTEILNWEHVEKHELTCVHKTVNCPVSWTCNEIVSITDLNQHCLTKHKKNVFHNILILPFEESLEKRKITVALLLHRDNQFLVFRVITTENIWIKVFSFLPLENCKYEFDICSHFDECCLAYRNPVELFVEKKHCKRCVMNDCVNILHDKTKRKMDETLTNLGYQQIPKEMVTRLQLINLRLKIIMNDDNDTRDSVFLESI